MGSDRFTPQFFRNNRLLRRQEMPGYSREQYEADLYRLGERDTAVHHQVVLGLDGFLALEVYRLIEAERKRCTRRFKLGQLAAMRRGLDIAHGQAHGYTLETVRGSDGKRRTVRVPTGPKVTKSVK